MERECYALRDKLNGFLPPLLASKGLSSRPDGAEKGRHKRSRNRSFCVALGVGDKCPRIQFSSAGAGEMESTPFPL